MRDLCGSSMDQINVPHILTYLNAICMSSNTGLACAISKQSKDLPPWPSIDYIRSCELLVMLQNVCNENHSSAWSKWTDLQFSNCMIETKLKHAVLLFIYSFLFISNWQLWTTTHAIIIGIHLEKLTRKQHIKEQQQQLLPSIYNNDHLLLWPTITNTIWTDFVTQHYFHTSGLPTYESSLQ